MPSSTISPDTPEQTTYPVGAAARLTGLTPERIRAWESRYGAIRPLRTEGGTRLYTPADLERLRLLRAAVDAGMRIGRIADLDTDALRATLEEVSPSREGRFAEVIAAIEALDGVEARRILVAEMTAQGTLEFTRDYMVPLVHELGRLWAEGRITVAAEHMATSLLRSLAATTLGTSTEAASGPRIVFATPSGEPHDLGLLAAALTAMAAGADPIFLGADVPETDLLASVRRAKASALAIGLVTLPPEEAEPVLDRLRRALPDEVAIWLGGFGADACRIPPGVTRVTRLELLEELVTDLRLGERIGRGSADARSTGGDPEETRH